MNTQKFTLDSSTNSYEAVSYGARWNGWMTPVVTRETFEKIVQDEDPRGEWIELSFDSQDVSAFVTHNSMWDGDDETVVIAPDSNGNYDLSHLGWTFCDVEDDDLTSIENGVHF